MRWIFSEGNDLLGEGVLCVTILTVCFFIKEAVLHKKNV